MKTRQSWKTISSISSQDESSASPSCVVPTLIRTHTHTHAYTATSRACTRGIRATKGWKRAQNAHLGKGVAFATVVDSAATKHTPLLACLDEREKKGRIVDTREGGRERRSWKPEDSVIDALTRTSAAIFFPRETLISFFRTRWLIIIILGRECVRACVEDRMKF